MAKFGYGPEDYKQAEWLADHLDKGWRYDHTTEQWHHWDGTRWAPDQTRQIEAAVAREALRGIEDDPAHGATYLKLMNLTPMRRALEALATFEGYGTNGDDWDAIP